MASIKLMASGSQVTYRHNPSGKVQVNKAPDGHASPNRADSVMIAFAPVRTSSLSIMRSDGTWI